MNSRKKTSGRRITGGNKARGLMSDSKKKKKKKKVVQIVSFALKLGSG